MSIPVGGQKLREILRRTIKPLAITHVVIFVTFLLLLWIYIGWSSVECLFSEYTHCSSGVFVFIGIISGALFLLAAIPLVIMIFMLQLRAKPKMAAKYLFVAPIMAGVLDSTLLYMLFRALVDGPDSLFLFYGWYYLTPYVTLNVIADTIFMLVLRRRGVIE